MTGETSDRTMDEIADIGVLSTIQDLKSDGSLADKDQSLLLANIQTPWAKKIAQLIIEDDQIDTKDKEVLRQHSSAF